LPVRRGARAAAAAAAGRARKPFSFLFPTRGAPSAPFPAGARGHVAVVDWGAGPGACPRAQAEFHVRESVRGAVWAAGGLLALAQRKYVFLYDGHSGAEVHKLTHHVQPRALEYLPYHFLLASLGHAGWLKYQDVSTGALVASHNTRAAHTAVLRANPWNAVLCAGQADGAVSMWTPNMSTAVAKLLAHRGPVTALAVDGAGRYLVTAGGDARLKVWDIRKFQAEPLYSYFTPTPATTLDVSGRGFVAVGFGSHVQIWGRDFATELSPEPITAPLVFAAPAPAAPAAAPAAPGEFPPGRRPVPELPRGLAKARAPYLKHELPGNAVACLRFRPFDDLLAVGHERGLLSLVVPGAGEPNYDSREADPLATKKARQEAEVHALLDKLAPGMISLDPTRVGAVDAAAPAVREAERKADEAAAAAAAAAAAPARRKRKRIKKKHANIVTAARVALQEKNLARLVAHKEAKAAAEDAAAAAAAGGGAAAEAPAPARGGSALSRFFAPKHGGARA
jgi:U3 small nucleolar RNA-associated protein 7